LIDPKRDFKIKQFAKARWERKTHFAAAFKDFQFAFQHSHSFLVEFQVSSLDAVTIAEWYHWSWLNVGGSWLRRLFHFLPEAVELLNFCAQLGVGLQIVAAVGDVRLRLLIDEQWLFQIKQKLLLWFAIRLENARWVWLNGCDDLAVLLVLCWRRCGAVIDCWWRQYWLRYLWLLELILQIEY